MNSSRAKRTGIGAIAFLLICLLFLQFQPGSVENQADLGPQFDYPRQWSAEELPKIPDGDMVWASKGNFENGVEFELSVNQSIEEIREFYEQEFYDRDYDYYDQEETDGEYSNEFGSGDFDVTVDVRPDPRDSNASRVSVRVRKHKDARTKVDYASSAVIFD